MASSLDLDDETVEYSIPALIFHLQTAFDRSDYRKVIALLEKKVEAARLEGLSKSGGGRPDVRIETWGIMGSMEKKELEKVKSELERMKKEKVEREESLYKCAAKIVELREVNMKLGKVIEKQGRNDKVEDEVTRKDGGEMKEKFKDLKKDLEKEKMKVEELKNEIKDLKKKEREIGELKVRISELGVEVRVHERCGMLRAELKREIERERVKKEEAEARERRMKGEMEKAKEAVKMAKVEVEKMKIEVKEMEGMADIAGEKLEKTVGDKALVERSLEKFIKENELLKERNLKLKEELMELKRRGRDSREREEPMEDGDARRTDLVLKNSLEKYSKEKAVGDELGPMERIRKVEYMVSELQKFHDLLEDESATSHVVRSGAQRINYKGTEDSEIVIAARYDHHAEKGTVDVVNQRIGDFIKIENDEVLSGELGFQSSRKKGPDSTAHCSAAIQRRISPSDTGVQDKTVERAKQTFVAKSPSNKLGQPRAKHGLVNFIDISSDSDDGKESELLPRLDKKSAANMEGNDLSGPLNPLVDKLASSSAGSSVRFPNETCDTSQSLLRLKRKHTPSIDEVNSENAQDHISNARRNSNDLSSQAGKRTCVSSSSLPVPSGEYNRNSVHSEEIIKVTEKSSRELCEFYLNKLSSLPNDEISSSSSSDSDVEMPDSHPQPRPESETYDVECWR